MKATLQQFVKTHDLNKVQPLIAQFFPVGKDSTHINIGFYIDKEVKGEGDVSFAQMPKGGPLYAAKFNGKFNQRQKIYEGIHQYFINHLYQQAILPFESYLDDKLPTSDTDKVNIQVNFSTYF
jgi:effector-binding domain-containing protein